jgi:hypothetical protein
MYDQIHLHVLEVKWRERRAIQVITVMTLLGQIFVPAPGPPSPIQVWTPRNLNSVINQGSEYQMVSEWS